jgi:hypothetical protein
LTASRLATDGGAFSQFIMMMPRFFISLNLNHACYLLSLANILIFVRNFTWYQGSEAYNKQGWTASTNNEISKLF